MDFNKQLEQPVPELTTSVRLPVVILPTERHFVKISTLLLSEITRSRKAGLQIKRMFRNCDAYKCQVYLTDCLPFKSFPYNVQI